MIPDNTGSEFLYEYQKFDEITRCKLTGFSPFSIEKNEEHFNRLLTGAACLRPVPLQETAKTDAFLTP